MSTQSARKGIIHAIRHKLAALLHEPTETPWQRFRTWGYDTPVPAMQPIQPVLTQPIAHIPLIDGIAGADRWPGPVGSWSAIQTGRLPIRRRETGTLGRPVRLLAMPADPGQLPQWTGRTTTEDLFALDEEDVKPDLADDGAPTILAPATIARRRQQWTDAMNQLPSSEQKESEMNDANN